MCKNIFLKTLSLALCALFICGIFTACGKTEQTLSGSSQASSETLSDVSYTESSYSVVKPRLSTAFAHYDGNKPLIEWSNVEGKKGVSARVVLKDKSGKTVLDQSGITTDIYAVSAALKKGEEYTLFVYYKIFDEEAGLISGVPEKGIKVKFLEQKGKYYFDGGISLDVLNNYLNRAMTYCHVRSDDISILKASIVDAGAKYIQRADCAWVPQAWDYSLQSGITEKLKKLHAMDPEIIFEACIFEYMDQNVNEIPIPAETFKAFGLPVENRNFSYDKMNFTSGYPKNNWSDTASVPDITKTETQMFFYHRACFFIDMGFEAIHLGQAKLIGYNDKDNECWTKVINMIRDYAAKNARRHYVILDAHYPGQKFLDKNGNALVDFNASPTRMKVAKGQTSHAPSEGNPQECVIEKGYKDSVYGLSRRLNSPSGWYTNKYPYLVEIDNYGVDEAKLNKASADIWGYDEITWFAIQPQSYRQKFTEYLIKEIDSFDENGHAAIVGKRWITNFPGRDKKLTTYYALGKAGDINFFGDLDFYKNLWNKLNK
ncbi:MAG: hypothetical protein E7548_05840 [Ruminococcaceae bacterium]|nr:hypothetical protein [Oscillospiraceae bacterium]